MELKIERDEEKCLDCIFLRGSILEPKGECLLFRRALTPESIHGSFEYFEPCWECEQVWWKDK